MNTPATQLRRVEDVVRLPDGVYEGIWGGYRVTFSAYGIQYEAQTQNGIKMTHAKCKVTSKDGKLSVEVVR
jgi:hypothetical protein